MSEERSGPEPDVSEDIRGRRRWGRLSMADNVAFQEFGFSIDLKMSTAFQILTHERPLGATHLCLEGVNFVSHTVWLHVSIGSARSKFHTLNGVISHFRNTHVGCSFFFNKFGNKCQIKTSITSFQQRTDIHLVDSIVLCSIYLGYCWKNKYWVLIINSLKLKKRKQD